MDVRFGRQRLRGLAPLVVVTAFSVLVAPAAGQDGSRDDRWLPWLGCWTEVDAPADSPMLCIVPEDGGVAALAVGRTGPTARSAWLADGVMRPVSASGCAGEEAAEFSRDGRRVYLRSDQTCEGGVERATRSLIAMVERDQWIYARAMDVDGRTVGWVTRYRPAPLTRIEAAGMDEALAAVEARKDAVGAARLAASGPIAVDALIEAHDRTDPEAVRAWIAEKGEPMELNADRLVRLADAGVAPEVIDVAIAVSYPERFQVAREPEGAGYGEAYGRAPRRVYSSWGPYGFFDPFYFDPFYYNPYYYNLGYRYPYRYYSPYGSYYGGTVVVVRPTTEQPRSQGRVIKGRGYTRGSTGGDGARAGVRAPSQPSRATIGTGRTPAPTSSSKGKAKKKGGG